MPLMAIGAIGVISVWSNVAPADVHDMCAAFSAGDLLRARELQLKAQPLVDALFSEVNPIPVKKALNLMGLEVGPLRSPLTEMTPENAGVCVCTAGCMRHAERAVQRREDNVR